jgi:hypothetical protein
MQEGNKSSSPGSDDMANYNPTNRNFDQSDVSGKAEKINNPSQQSPGGDEDLEETDPPLTEEDLEQTGLSAEEADQIEWQPPQEGGTPGSSTSGRNAPEK